VVVVEIDQDAVTCTQQMRISLQKGILADERYLAQKHIAWAFIVVFLPFFFAFPFLCYINCKSHPTVNWELFKHLLTTTHWKSCHWPTHPLAVVQESGLLKTLTPHA